MEGEIDDSRSRGRQKKKYLDGLVAAGVRKERGALPLAQDRERFKYIVVIIN